MPRKHRNLRAWRERVQQLLKREPNPPQPKPKNMARLSKNGSPKGFQFHPEAIRFFENNPSIILDFLDFRLQARQAGPVHKGPLTVELFDPKDQSKWHSFLYRVRFKGKSFFVKELYNPVFPVDAVTQFVVHDHLNQLSHELSRWNARVLPYRVAWASKRESFLVSEWVNGIMLEKWLKSRLGRELDEVYQRFLRTERFLRHHHVKDVTTRNTIYNPKTNELVIIDLHPGKVSS